MNQKNPEVTVCQVQEAMTAVIPWWWRGKRVPGDVLRTTIEGLEDKQQKAARSRASHTEKTRHKLRELGIKLNTVHRCRCDTS